MSSFSVEVVRLDAVHPHPQADRLELAQIGGYRAVVLKGLHQPGDLVVYVPEASVIPQDVIDAWGFTGKLAGSKKNRVKAIKLRGELSQGLVIPAQAAFETACKRVGPDQRPNIVEIAEGQDFASILGIEKYETPIPIEMAGRQRNRPEWLPMYTDIENVKKYNRVLIEGEEVIFTEKIHGTSFAAGMHKDDLALVVSSRRCVLEPDEFNLYWRAATQAGLKEELIALLESTGAESIVMFGEVYGKGVQDLTYGVPEGKIEMRLFDIMVNAE